MEWQPIETAPKDGTVIHLYDGGEMLNCQWRGINFGDKVGAWWQQHEYVPDFWLRIDASPTAWRRCE